MEKGAVQATTTYVPFSAQMILNGTGRLLTTANAIYGQPWVAGGLVVTRTFGKAHPHAVEAILRAVLRAEALIKSNPQLSDTLLAKYSGSPAASIAYSYAHNLLGLLPLIPNTTDLIKEASTEATYKVFHGNPQSFLNSWVNPRFAEAVSK